MLVLPSPKSQLHDAGEPVDSSVNVTSNGAVPDVGEAIKRGNGTVVAVSAKVYSSADTEEDMPLGVVTRTSTCPTVELAGVVAVISVEPTTTNWLLPCRLQLQSVAPGKPVPVIVIGSARGNRAVCRRDARHDRDCRGSCIHRYSRGLSAGTAGKNTTISNGKGYRVGSRGRVRI